MTRGNQRELARQKNMKNQNKAKKADEMQGNKGLTKEQRQQRDADMMRLKQQKAAEKKAAETAAGAGGGKK
ncbi:Small EDRK-rich factor 2 [Amphibalanus amphitrite]|uniref:Small EDRK-rich factor 2 n=1 Tax=Amphibalanus amphitrite TaxID=1232801 RepID=A0A6A4VJI9_AMPAM|nr:Small EDRK-rich factor 2 [Amphibalanus amphitrite]